jgi:hypothetical protein
MVIATMIVLISSSSRITTMMSGRPYGTHLAPPRYSSRIICECQRASADVRREERRRTCIASGPEATIALRRWAWKAGSKTQLQNNHDASSRGDGGGDELVQYLDNRSTSDGLLRVYGHTKKRVLVVGNHHHNAPCRLHKDRRRSCMIKWR